MKIRIVRTKNLTIFFRYKFIENERKKMLHQTIRWFDICEKYMHTHTQKNARKKREKSIPYVIDCIVFNRQAYNSLSKRNEQQTTNEE